MPDSLRRASVLISRHCLEESIEDKGASIHDVLELATHPAAEWGLAAFAAPFDMSDVVLIDPDLGLPTEDCVEAGRDGTETNIMERLQHEQLRDAVRGTGKRSRKAYSEIRGFVVRNPVLSIWDLKKFEAKWATASRAIRGFYTTVPMGAVHSDGRIRTCKNCGALLWPDSDTSSYPNGRCRVRSCAEEMPTPALATTIDNPSEYVAAERSVLAYWIGPGLDEIRLFDRLSAGGIDVVLYPEEDSADVGTEDLMIGIDVKTYTSPIILARRLSAGIGNLSIFKAKYIAVPDAKLKSDPDYLTLLRTRYTGAERLVFDTVSNVVKDVAAADGQAR